MRAGLYRRPNTIREHMKLQKRIAFSGETRDFDLFENLVQRYAQPE